MMTIKDLNRQLIWIVVALLGCVLGWFFQTHYAKKMVFEQEIYGTKLDKPRNVAPFEMMGTDQHRFDNQSLKGQWTFMFFGFTHCQSICPTTMAMLSKMMMLLNESPTKPQVVMVTLDPKHDDLKRLGAYVQAFDPSFIGARGTTTALKGITQNLGIAYAHVTPKSKKADAIEHSGAVILFNPEGKLVAFFTPPLDAEKMAQDFAVLSA